MPVQITPHPLYEAYRKSIEQVNWIYNGSAEWFDGEQIIDSRAAEFMLPKSEADKEGNEYLNRLKRARWKGLFKRTIETIGGFLSRFHVRPETIAYLPEEKREEVLSNIDLLGSSLEAFLGGCDVASLRDGFCAVLIDYTRAGENGRPFFTRLDRANILKPRYHYDEMGTMVLDELTFVRTSYEETENGQYKLKYEYVTVDSEKYTIQSAYEPAIARKERQETIVEKTTLPQPEPETIEIPHTYGGIPIVFYPDNTVAPFELPPPLLAVAEADRAWYRTNSDLEENRHYKSNPIIVREGAIQNYDETPPPIKLGARYVLDIPAGGRVYIVETTGEAIRINQERLKELESEIQVYTMDFVAVGNRSATEAGLIGAGNQATLAHFTVRKQSAVEEMFRAFDRWLRYEAKGGGIEMDLSQFKIFDPNYFRELKDLLLAGRLTDEAFWKMVSAMGGLPQGVEVADIIGEAIEVPENENRSPSEQIDPEDSIGEDE